MSCQTCGHTTHRIGCQITECGGSYWCPRCGTISTEGYVSTPALVDRCRTFEHAVAFDRVLYSLLHSAEWGRLGIGESINPPESRKV